MRLSERSADPPCLVLRSPALRSATESHLVGRGEAKQRGAIKYHGEFARLNFPREDYANEILTTIE